MKRGTLTCGNKENSSAEDDVVSTPVKLTGSYTQASQEQQAHAHDGEDTGGSHGTCGHTLKKEISEKTNNKYVEWRLHLTDSRVKTIFIFFGLK